MNDKLKMILEKYNLKDKNSYKIYSSKTIYNDSIKELYNNILQNNNYVGRSVVSFIDKDEEETVYFYIDIEFHYNDKENKKQLFFVLKDKEGEIERIVVKLDNDEIDNMDEFITKGVIYVGIPNIKRNHPRFANSIDELWLKPEDDDVDDFDWYPSIYFWGGGNYKIIVGDEVEEIEVLDEEVFKKYKFSTILKIKYKDEQGKIKKGYVGILNIKRNHPTFANSIDELDERFRERFMFFL